MASDCLSENSAIDLIEGVMAASARDRAQLHLDDCDRCRMLISALAAEAFAASSHATLTTEPRAGDRLLPAGATLGRYVILDVLGAGGMGIVYGAYDPRLERKIALKRVRMSGLDAGEARARVLGERLVREAQAMARLSHPNVTTIYDAGTEAGELFIAMELVDGTTLRSWLGERRRTWREIIAVFVAAGRGLEAAHAAGLVHRDFKPDNVLIARSGRVSVSDFGLACAADPDAGDDALASDRALGTPAYMAPEQRHGRADARSDQYSFCAALHEALWGDRPSGLPQPRAPREPAFGRVPRSVRRVIERGIATDPDQRFGSMAAVLARLERATHRAYGMPLAVAAGCAVVAGLWLRSTTAAAPCGGARARLAGAWGVDGRLAVRAAVLAHDAPYAAATWQAVEHALDGYTDRWSAMYGEACQATAVDHAQPQPVLALRMACLEQRQQELEQAIAQLASPTTPIDRAAQVAASLPNVSRCADVAALSAPVPPPSDPLTTARVAEARTQLARAKAQCDAGLYAACASTARTLLVDARAIGYAPLIAQTEFRLALADIRLKQIAEAEQALDAAFLAAEAGRDDETAANVSAAEVIVVGYFAGRYDEGVRQVARAEAAIARLATTSPRLAYDATGALLASRSSLAYGHRDLAEAVALGTDAIAHSEQTYGRESPQTARLHLNQAATLEVLGRFDDALAELDRAREIFEAAEGAGHPDLLQLDKNTGTLLLELGRYDEASQRLERALAAVEAAPQPDRHQLVSLLEALSALRSDQGRAQEALALIERALAQGETQPPVEQLTAMMQRAVSLSGVGRKREAEQASAAALAFGEQTLGPNNAALIPPLRELAVAACNARRVRDASARFERALTLARGANGSPHAAAELDVLYGDCLGETGQVARGLARIRAARTAAVGAAGGERIVATADELIAKYAHPAR